MFSSVLVANRGEIARRVIKACQAVDVSAISVFSEADADLLHVSEGDSAVQIGPAPARESYLRIDAILDAARRTEAGAVHPGYGFLSENADFAQAVLDAGLVWIGPAPDTIRAMGDKQRAREIAVSAGVPVVPGSRRFSENDTDEIVKAAKEVGFPLLVKASAGGGGIGMKRVDDEESLSQSVLNTQSMAAKAFGDGTVFLEKLIPSARHVEIQVFGYGDGTGIHLFERDCSLQRRFQKVIEESPAPGLRPEVRAQMAEAAVELCRKTRYTGAGTVEFIVDASTQEFFFLEMNTRIQVEHPVTEMVTGMDLVAMQIQHAQGILAPIEQNAVASAGAAIECRLYAENPSRMFMPSPGTLERFRFPEQEDVRVDTGYQEGDVVTPYYDPMIAKLVVHAENRNAARMSAASALRKTEIEGIKTNRDFLIACLEHESFAAGDVSTGFIEANVKELNGAS